MNCAAHPLESLEASTRWVASFSSIVRPLRRAMSATFTPASTPTSPAPLRPSLPYALTFGALSLCAVSLVAYSPWAFHLVKGDPLLFSATAAIYIVVGGLAL